MNKYFVSLLALVVFLAGCSFFNTPARTAKSWLDLTEKGKTEEVLKLYSSKAMREKGAEIKSTLDSHIEGIARLKESGKVFSSDKVEEKITGDTALVSLIYRAGEGDSLRMTFGMEKENGEWKINGINEPEHDPPTEIEPITPRESRELPPPEEVATPTPTKKGTKK